MFASVFFHFEFFRVQRHWRIVTVGNQLPKLPGGLTIDMWDYANDFDIFNEYAHIIKENQFHT